MKYTNFFQNIIFFLLVVSCSSTKIGLTPTNNIGGYKMHINSDDKTPNEIHIFGKVVDVLTKKPLSHTELTIDCYKIQTLADGTYSFKTKSTSDLNIYVKAISLGYKTIETAFFPLNKNSINIDFYLAEDDRPFINCGGINYTDFNE